MARSMPLAVLMAVKGVVLPSLMTEQRSVLPRLVVPQPVILPPLVVSEPMILPPLVRTKPRRIPVTQPLTELVPTEQPTLGSLMVAEVMALAILVAVEVAILMGLVVPQRLSLVPLVVAKTRVVGGGPTDPDAKPNPIVRLGRRGRREQERRPENDPHPCHQGNGPTSHGTPPKGDGHNRHNAYYLPPDPLVNAFFGFFRGSSASGSVGSPTEPGGSPRRARGTPRTDVHACATIGNRPPHVITKGIP